jgi:hypothetical protein
VLSVRTFLETVFVAVFVLPFVLVLLGANLVRLKCKISATRTLAFIAAYAAITGVMSYFTWLALQHIR